MTLEVLVATVNDVETDWKKRMNLQSNAIIANQTSFTGYDEINDDILIKRISTNTRGVGINRNIALIYSLADIILFADDDIKYYDGYVDGVVSFFEKHPQADAVIFDMELTHGDTVWHKFHTRDKRISIWSALKFGTCSVAVRRNFILRKNLHFSHIFGGGCIYSCGEDSIMLLDLFRSGAKVYTSSFVLGRSCTDLSSWFRGYTEKYFYDKGVWLESAFPKFKYILMYYYMLRLYKHSDVPRNKIIHLMLQGMQGVKILKTFSTWKNENGLD